MGHSLVIEHQPQYWRSQSTPTSPEHAQDVQFPTCASRKAPGHIGILQMGWGPRVFGLFLLQIILIFPFIAVRNSGTDHLCWK